MLLPAPQNMHAAVISLKDVCTAQPKRPAGYCAAVGAHIIMGQEPPHQDSPHSHWIGPWIGPELSWLRPGQPVAKQLPLSVVAAFSSTSPALSVLGVDRSKAAHPAADAGPFRTD